MNNVLTNALKTLKMQNKVAQPTAVAGTWAAQQSQQAFEKQTSEASANKTLVETNNNPLIKTPNNIKDGVIPMIMGENVPQTLKININTDAQTTNTTIVLGKVLGYKAFNPSFTGNLSGIVTGKGKLLSSYELLLEELCSKTYIINSITMTVNPSTNAATGDTSYKGQLSIDWMRFWTNGQGVSGSAPIDWSETDSPYFTKDNVRSIDLSQMEGKLDMYSSIALTVLPKVDMALTFNVTLRGVVS